MKLSTKRFFTRQEIDILRTSLKIERKTALDYVEFEIPFENIHNKRRIQTSTNHNFVVLSIILFLIGMFLIGANPELSALAFLIGTFFLAFALFARKKTVTISTYDGSNIELPFTNKNKQDVLDFSTMIIEASNQFLLNKYGRIDRGLPIDSQLSKLEFLRDREILSDEEYDNLKNQLLGREHKSHLGFARSQ